MTTSPTMMRVPKSEAWARRRRTWLVVFYSCCLFARYTSAFPSGAGGCKGGEAAVEESHVADGKTTLNGSLEQGGFQVTIDDVDITEVGTLTVNTDYVLAVTGTAYEYKGVLMRVQGKEEQDLSGAMVPGLNTGVAEVCGDQPGSVVGLTHTSSEFKTSHDGILNIAQPSTIHVDVTIVGVNNATATLYAYSGYQLKFRNIRDTTTEAPVATPDSTLSPVVSPMNPTKSPSRSPTEAPTAKPTAEEPLDPTSAPVEAVSPTEAPAVEPTSEPTADDDEPAKPSAAPAAQETAAPFVLFMDFPTASPSVVQETDAPTKSPTEGPTEGPVADATNVPAPPLTTTNVPAPPLTTNTPTLAPSSQDETPTSLTTQGPMVFTATNAPVSSRSVEFKAKNLVLSFPGATNLQPSEQDKFQSLTESWFNNFYNPEIQRRRLQKVMPYDIHGVFAGSMDSTVTVTSAVMDSNTLTVTYDHDVSYESLPTATGPQQYTTLPFRSTTANADYTNLLSTELTAFESLKGPVQVPKLMGPEPLAKDGGLSMGAIVGIVVAVVALSIIFLASVLLQRQRTAADSVKKGTQEYDKDALSFEREEAASMSSSRKVVDDVGSAVSSIGVAQSSDEGLPGCAVVNPDDEYVVYAPSGKLGLVLDTPDDKGPVVYIIKENSPLLEKMEVGDRLVAVDEVDVRSMSPTKVSKLISKRSANPMRKFTLITRATEGSENKGESSQKESVT